MNKYIKSPIIIFLLFLILSDIEAGLLTTFTEVVIDNLQLGKSYSLKKIFNMPYNVKNIGRGIVGIKIKIEMPDKRILRKGYEIPEDFQWIKLERTNFQNVKPGETVYSDIIINIPDNDKYLGKQYQVSIVAETYSSGDNISSFEFAVESILRFSIAPVRIQTSQEEIDQLNLNLNFKVFPENIYITNFDIDKQKNQKVFIGTLKIENYDDIEHQYIIRSLSEKEVKIIQRGYEACPDPKFLTFSQNEITVPPKSTKTIDSYITFPFKEEYKGKKYQFTISTSIKQTNNKIQGNLFTRIFVTTKR